MNRFTPGDFSSKDLTSIYQDLADFGKKGHERIVIRKNDQTGQYYPATASKPRGISWLLSFFTFYKSEENRVKTISKFVLDFLEQANRTNSESQSSHEDKGNLNSNNIYLNTIMVNPLLDNLAEHSQSKQRWEVLRNKITKDPESILKDVQRKLDEAKSLRQRSSEVYNSMVEKGEKKIEQGKKIQQELIAKGNAEKEALIRAGKQEAERLILSSVHVEVDGKGLMSQLREEPFEKGETIIFRCKDDKEGIKAHKYVLQTLKGKEAKPNYFNHIFDETFKEEIDEITLTQDYPASTVNCLLDFIYGVSKTYEAKDLPDLLGVLHLLHAMGLDHREHLSQACQTCREVCTELFAQSPSLLVKAVIEGPSTIQNFIFGQQRLGVYLQGDTLRGGMISQEDKELLFNQTRDSNKPHHQVIQGMCHEWGICTEKNYEKAVDYYRKAGKNNPIAQTYLGYCYERGLGVKQNSAEAVEYYRKAAKKGYLHAQYILGTRYEHGIGVNEDKKQAFLFLEKAAKQGYLYGQLALGNCYASGIGVEKNVKKALEIYQKLFDQGFLPVNSALAHMYENGIGVEKDTKKAFSILEKAANRGHIHSIYLLSFCYSRGNGIEKNSEQALKLLHESANRGSLDAFYSLGYWYENNTPRDLKKAFDYYKKGAEEGQKDCKYELGRFYEYGIETEKNLDKAFDLYLQAQAQGLKRAEDKLANWEH